MDDVNLNSDPVPASPNGTAVTDETSPTCSGVRQRENSYGTPDA